MEKNLKQKGFSLIEVMTTIFIIALLSTIIFTVNRQSNKYYTLLRVASKLAQDIRIAAQMATNTSKCPTGTDCAGSVPRGYGVYFDLSTLGNTTYLLYADTDAGVSQDYTVGVDAVIKTIDLERGITIQSIIPASPLSINFKPPDPIVKISGGAADECTITLELAGFSRIKKVKVNKSGQVWIE